MEIEILQLKNQGGTVKIKFAHFKIQGAQSKRNSSFLKSWGRNQKEIPPIF